MNNDEKRMAPEEIRATLGLGTVFSLRMFGMFMVLPVLTTYGMVLQGANEALLGIAIGIYGITQACFQIPFGLLSDKVGRKFIIITGLVIFVAGSIIAALSESIWGMILGRALQGSGAISAAVMALLSDLTREQNRTKAMALVGISFGITFAAAMVLGPILTHRFGLHSLFWLIAVLASLAIIVTLFYVPSPVTSLHHNRNSFNMKDLHGVFAHKQLMKLNISIFMLQLLLMSNFVALPVAMVAENFQAPQHWKAYLITMLISFITVLPFIIYGEKKRRIKQVFIFCVALIFCTELILISSRNSLWLIFLGIQCFFVAFNILEAFLPSLISKQAPANYKGTAMGIYSTFQFMGVGIGGSLSGWLMSLSSPTLVFCVCSVMALLWLLLSLTLQQPAYISNLKITVPESISWTKTKIEEIFNAQPGVVEATYNAEESVVYVKADTKKTTVDQFDNLVQ